VASPFQPGEVLAGKYVVERFVGQGGTGIVLAARHTMLDQRVAVKLLHDHLVALPEVATRFLREAQACAKLTSPHSARVMDADRLETGRPFIVLEYLEGRDLRVVVKEDGPLAPQVAARHLVQAASALAEAHSLGIVHRDIKPSNLFLTSERSGMPHVKVLDFGISKLLPLARDLGESFDTLTHSGQVLGSLHFMSPEQMRSPRSVDTRTDIWSLGVTLFVLVTGRYPFGGSSLVDLLNEILRGPRPPLGPDAPAALEAIVSRCLRVDPSGRYASADELARELARFAGDVPQAARLVASDGSASVPGVPIAVDGGTHAPSRHQAPAVARPIAAAALAVAAIGALSVWGASAGVWRRSTSAERVDRSPLPTSAPIAAGSLVASGASARPPGDATASDKAVAPLPGSASPAEGPAAHGTSVIVARPLRALGHKPQAGQAAISSRAVPSAAPTSAAAARPLRSDADVIHDLPH
jgi:tRNA A-37 threonylcarbamoyl transferase component Bud32